MELFGWQVRAGWCTRDWAGGSSYGHYSFRTMLKYVWQTRRDSRFDRQAPQWSVIFSGGEGVRASEYVFFVDFKMVDLCIEHWPGWEPSAIARPQVRYLYLNPLRWRHSTWFKVRA